MTTDEIGKTRISVLVTQLAIGTVIGVLLFAGGPRLVQAADAGAITEDNVAQRIATAKTATDHEALAAFYRSQAAAAGQQVKRHQAMLKSYEKVGGKMKAHMDRHCGALIQSYKEQEKQEEDLAKEHEQLAKTLQAAPQ